jgi:hypothetical protein
MGRNGTAYPGSASLKRREYCCTAALQKEEGRNQPGEDEGQVHKGKFIGNRPLSNASGVQPLKRTCCPLHPA